MQTSAGGAVMPRLTRAGVAVMARLPDKAGRNPQEKGEDNEGKSHYRLRYRNR